MLAVHRLNNLLASLVIGASNQPSGKARREKQSANNAMHVRTALAFTPLLAIPDELTPQQIVAVLRKYLDAHPEKSGHKCAAAHRRRRSRLRFREEVGTGVGLSRLQQAIGVWKG